MTLGFTLMSLAMSIWIYSGKSIWSQMESWRKKRSAACFFYFALMEGLQYIQYLVIDQCDNPINNFTTILGWIHISFQPIFSNLAMSAIDRRNLDRSREETWRAMIKLSFYSSFFLSLRIIIPLIFSADTVSKFFDMCNSEVDSVCTKSESVRSCSVSGRYHIGWQFYLIKQSYLFPNLAMHFILMFIIPFAMNLHFESLLLFFTGPFLCIFFETDDGERSAIWCFFSIMEALITFGSQLLIILRGRNPLKSKSQ